MNGKPASAQLFPCGPKGLGRFNAYMVREPTFKGIVANLIEVSYLSNVSEVTKLLNPDYVDNQGYAIYAGIVGYLGKIPTPRNPPAAPDFTISANPPTTQSVNQGNSVSFPLSFQGLNGFNSFVNLSVSGLPANLQYGSGINNGANFTNIAAIYVPANSTTGARFSILTSTATPATSYQITVVGTSGNLSHSVKVALTVNPPPRPPLSVSCIFNPGTINLGSSSTVTATGTGGTPPYQFLLPNSVYYGNSSSTVVTQTSTGMIGYQLMAKDSTGQTSSTNCSVQVNGMPPTISNYRWNKTPKNRVNFSGTISGTNIVPGTQVFLCVNGSSTCYQQPPSLVTVNNSSMITVTNVNLPTGSWQIYLKHQYGSSSRSSAFYVNP